MRLPTETSKLDVFLWYEIGHIQNQWPCPNRHTGQPTDLPPKHHQPKHRKQYARYAE